MKTLNFPTSACRHCRHYNVEGRRGGMCEQLGVPVKGSWKACSLALPPFAPSWENVEEILQDEKLLLEEAFSVNCSLATSQVEFTEKPSPPGYEELEADVMLV